MIEITPIQSRFYGIFQSFVGRGRVHGGFFLLNNVNFKHIFKFCSKFYKVPRIFKVVLNFRVL